MEEVRGPAQAALSKYAASALAGGCAAVHGVAAADGTVRVHASVIRGVVGIILGAILWACIVESFQNLQKLLLG